MAIIMGQLKYNTSDINKILDGRYHSPIQDVVGSDWTVGSPLALLAETPVVFQCNGAIRNKKTFPDHITNIWNTSTNIATFSEFLNTPEIVANVNMTLDPSASSEGILTTSVWVNEDVPILIKSTNVHFKGDIEKVTALLTFYAGEETGFDVKNKGVFFTVESSLGTLAYDMSVEIYRT